MLDLRCQKQRVNSNQYIEDTFNPFLDTLRPKTRIESFWSNDLECWKGTTCIIETIKEDSCLGDMPLFDPRESSHPAGRGS